MFDRRGAEIIMLHAIEEPSRSVRGLEVARSMAQMEFLGRQQFEFAQVSRRVERGRPADCILDYARSHEVDVIVMPGPDSLGHVTEEVLSFAPCAVWTDRTSAPTESARHICSVIGLDGADDAVMCQAAGIAGDLGVGLSIVHAVAPESPMELWWDVAPLEQETRLARLRVEELREQYAPTARLHVEAGRLEWVVSRELNRLDAGLLVAGGKCAAILSSAIDCPILRVATPVSQLDTRRTFAATA
jgi:nucleotide-binding universal stress UspA family protein